MSANRNNGNAKWRERPNVSTDETYHITMNGVPEHSLLHHVIDKQTEARIRLGLVCYECIAVFPARPSKETFRTFVNEGFRFSFPQVAKARIYNNCCPQCGSPITPEALALQTLDEGQFWGTGAAPEHTKIRADLHGTAPAPVPALSPASRFAGTAPKAVSSTPAGPSPVKVKAVKKHRKDVGIKGS